VPNDYPLFPLPLVAFPGCRLPLQIFETRYLDLVKSSLSTESSFGIVTLIPQAADAVSDNIEIYPVGTSVKIVDFNEQPNGLLGVVCEGLGKFEISQTERCEKTQLLMASIKPFEAEAIEAVPSEFEELVHVLTSLLEHPYVVSLGYPKFEIEDWLIDASKLGCYLSYLLPFPNAQRCRLLALDEPIVRLGMIQELLDEMDGSAS